MIVASSIKLLVRFSVFGPSVARSHWWFLIRIVINGAPDIAAVQVQIKVSMVRGSPACVSSVGPLMEANDTFRSEFELHESQLIW